jgi:protein-L-isoaspartate O-methyltransferase
MAFGFANEFDRIAYAEWHQPLLERLFGHEIDLRHELYELTHSHRREHNGGVDDGECTTWPSPPYYAPVWRLIADRIHARRFLEVGTGIGYTAALMADAGGLGCQVDTIEVDPDHADHAQRELARIGLSHRVRVIRGDAAVILPMLTAPYDVVFADVGTGTITSELDRLTSPGGAPADIKVRLREPLLSTLQGLRDTLAHGNQAPTVAFSEARDSYRRAIGSVLIPPGDRLSI